MLHVILLLCLFSAAVSSQLQTPTACGDFVHANYTAWSESYIGTWCKDHDPSSTAQCASVSWPPYVPWPKPTRAHRNIKDIISWRKPDLATRPDCIARSSALNMTAGARSNGLVEAVTCDMYKFDRHHRKRECVCFPVYSNHVATKKTPHLLTPTTSVSVFYPPEQLVESCLLAAATQGRPSTCQKSFQPCPTSVALLSHARPRMTLGHFPYCATPAQQAQPSLVARTISPRQATPPVSFDWGPIPTAKPPKHCKKSAANLLEQEQCENNKCLWDFIIPYTVTHSSCLQISNRSGSPFYTDWHTSLALITEPHWGTHRKPSITTTDRYCEEPTKTTTSARHLYTSCHDEQSCRDWCYADHKARQKRMRVLLLGGSIVLGVALLAMLCRICYDAKRRHRERHLQTKHGAEFDAVQEMELVRTIPGGDGLQEFVGEPGDGQATGSMRLRPDGGIRGRPRVRFHGADGNEDIAECSNDGMRRVSGPQSYRYSNDSDMS